MNSVFKNVVAGIIIAYVTCVCVEGHPTSTGISGLTLVTRVGRKYYFSDRQDRDLPNAMDLCKSIGMELGSMKTKQEADALIGAYNNENFYGVYWLNAKSKLVWSDSETLLKEDIISIISPTYEKTGVINMIHSGSYVSSVDPRSLHGTLCELVIPPVKKIN